MRLGLLAITLTFTIPLMGQVSLGLVQYQGGGDWYANPTALPNLAEFCNQNLGTNLNTEYSTLKLDDPAIFNYPYLHLTGHGNVVWSEAEKRNLKRYLKAGGFLHIDDNYGMDPFIRPTLESLFAEHPLRLMSKEHEIFKRPYLFAEGLPKIHLHDEEAPEAWGIFIEGRLALLYTHESDLGDGWEDQAVHQDPEEVREKALKMGANIIHYLYTYSATP